MIKQIRYFQAVVRCKNFTEAAEECYISQSAISQQIQALERELGVKLLHREKRKFFLTPAGEYFYRKSLIFIDDFEKICHETSRIDHGKEKNLRINYLKNYAGKELRQTIVDFTEKYPDISIQIKNGTHEELYDFLRTGQSDLVINDQRRAFSDMYINYKLSTGYVYIEIAQRNPIANLSHITVKELKNIPCILIASPAQEEIEQQYYKDIVGFNNEFIFANSLEEAHLMVVSNKGFMPVEFTVPPTPALAVYHIPLLRNNKMIARKYYAFWHNNTNNENHIEEFAAILKKNFALSAAVNKEK